MHDRRRNPLPRFSALFVTLFIVWPPVFFACVAGANPPPGIQPLQKLPQSGVRTLIQDPTVRPLLTPSEQERFLNELEKQPPAWDQLHDPPGEEQGARLFALNRKRDALREEHPLLTQRIAFLWSGVLSDYHEQHKGYTVALGPHPTQTGWGLVRFKPTGLPHELVAVPSPTTLQTLQNRRAREESVEIGILFTGTLIPWESIIYGFSHDGLEHGMIMPVVQVDGVQYVISVSH